jgi:hypothetical protein
VGEIIAAAESRSRDRDQHLSYQLSDHLYTNTQSEISLPARRNDSLKPDTNCSFTFKSDEKCLED